MDRGVWRAMVHRGTEIQTQPKLLSTHARTLLLPHPELTNQPCPCSLLACPPGRPSGDRHPPVGACEGGKLAYWSSICTDSRTLRCEQGKDEQRPFHPLPLGQDSLLHPCLHRSDPGLNQPGHPPRAVFGGGPNCSHPHHETLQYLPWKWGVLPTPGPQVWPMTCFDQREVS